MGRNLQKKLQKISKFNTMIRPITGEWWGGSNAHKCLRTYIHLYTTRYEDNINKIFVEARYPSLSES